MTAPLWVHELAGVLSSGSVDDRSFPRDLRSVMARTLPLTAVSLADLSIAGIDAWLRRQGVACSIHAPDRPLRGCLVAHNSHGALFLDSEDADAERRFSLAHELAHFLRDYWLPRVEAASRYGPTVLEVFDGKRAPRPEERVHALLARIPIGFRVHLMDRSDGRITDAAVARAEVDADRLAFELLAPESSPSFVRRLWAVR